MKSKTIPHLQQEVHMRHLQFNFRWRWRVRMVWLMVNFSCLIWTMLLISVTLQHKYFVTEVIPDSLIVISVDRNKQSLNKTDTKCIWGIKWLMFNLPWILVKQGASVLWDYNVCFSPKRWQTMPWKHKWTPKPQPWVTKPARYHWFKPAMKILSQLSIYFKQPKKIEPFHRGYWLVRVQTYQFRQHFSNKICVGP